MDATDHLTPSHGRELPGKHVKIRPDEYLVYHFWPKDFIRCTPDGNALTPLNEMGYVFDDLAAAQTYCQWKVNQPPKLGCLIYDHRWQIVERVFNPDYLKKIDRAKSPKRQLIWGALSLVAGIALIWLDASHSWMLIIGFLIGARLAVGGIVKLMLVLLNWR